MPDYHYMHLAFTICGSIFCVIAIICILLNKKYNREKQEREETAAKLEIASILNRCVKELTTDDNMDQAIQNLLGIINDYFEGDRTYIFHIDYERQVTYNTYEYTKDHVSRQIENLQEVPLTVIATWLKRFEESQYYYIASLEQEKGAPSYEVLAAQDIERLLAVPLLRDSEIIGFLGVDNPRKHNEDATLLSSLQFFITNSLTKKKEQEYLFHLSYRDMLTGLYNRNRYMEAIRAYQKGHRIKVGVAFIDVNGLKKVNDRYGHEAGDVLIRRTAACIQSLFPEQSFRIGGDEFVIMQHTVEKQNFEDSIQKLRLKIQNKQVSVSIGSLWEEQPDDLEDMLKQADALMYEEKEAYHKINGIYHGFYYAEKTE